MKTSLRNTVLIGALLGLTCSVRGEDVFVWFPLKAGYSWTYQHESREVNPKHPRITQWTTTEKIRELVPIPEGTIVEREVKTISGQPDGSWIGNYGAFSYLIRGSCISFLASEYWDGSKKTLRDAFRTGMLAGKVSPTLCFPLSPGRRWHSSGAEWQWNVSGRGCTASAFCPESVSASDFHVIARHAGSGGTFHLWFRKGIGITGEWYWHSGTYSELRVRLIRTAFATH